MRFSLCIRPAADADAEEAAAYIARDSLQSALDFYDAIDATYPQLREAPRLWPIYHLIADPRLPELRKRAVIGFPNHVVFYLVTGDAVDVLRVLHGARGIPAVLRRDVEDPDMSAKIWDQATDGSHIARRLPGG